MKIVLAGATGAVGRYVVQLIQQRTEVAEAHIFTRRSLDVEDSRIHEHIIQFDELESYQSDIQVDVAISALGTTQKKAGKEGFYKVDHDYVVALGKWALAHGAQKMIVVTSIGADEHSWYSFYLKTKGEVERDVKALGFEEVVFVRPPLLEGPRDERRPTEVIGSKVMAVLKPLFVGSLKYSLPVHLSQVAAAIYDEALKLHPGVQVLGPKEIHQFDAF